MYGDLGYATENIIGTCFVDQDNQFQASIDVCNAGASNSSTIY
jgi:hypothetical protein